MMFTLDCRDEATHFQSRNTLFMIVLETFLRTINNNASSSSSFVDENNKKKIIIDSKIRKRKATKV